jgi:hypothetical protein
MDTLKRATFAQSLRGTWNRTSGAMALAVHIPEAPSDSEVPQQLNNRTAQRSRRPRAVRTAP